MAPENLKVDTTALARAGENFLTASNAIPQAPAGYTPSGSDPLSTVIASLAPQFLAPIVSGLPLLKAETNQFAQNIKTVAERYAATDAQLHSKLSAQVGGSGSGGGAGGGGAASAAAGVGGSGSGAAGAASQGAGQLGQMMQVPMQIASQAAQLPQQVMGMAGQLPQTAMQGVQQIAEQVSQVAGKAGGGEKPEDKSEDEKHHEGKHRREDSPDEAEPAGAAPGTTPSERAPEDPHRHASPSPSPESVL